MKLRNLIYVAFVTALISSCVPLKSFKDIEKQNAGYASQNNRLTKENREKTVANKELNAQNATLSNEIDLLISDTLRLAKQVHDLNYSLVQSRKQYDDLVNAYESASSGNTEEMTQLLKELQNMQNDLQAREDALNSTQEALSNKRKNLEEAVANLEMAQNELEARNARILEMERILNQKDSIMNSLQTRVMEALKSYQGKGLEVHMKDGLLYVSLDEKLLFQSGKWDVDPNGVAALNKLSEVLANNPDIRVMIEGHTDNVPYNGSGQILDNWDLSVKRATAIVRILLKNPGIEPKNITAAGRSKYVPLDAANTPEARQKNRRTEIILTPNLDELMKVIGNVE